MGYEEVENVGVGVSEWNVVGEVEVVKIVGEGFGV